jgi:hypothetical protein
VGQFAFDRGQLDAGQAGLLAVVISAAAQAAALAARNCWRSAWPAQLAVAFQRPELAGRVEPGDYRKARHLRLHAGLVRPANASGLPGLVLAGDYTAGDYPATLESAVRSGQAAAKPAHPRPATACRPKTAACRTPLACGQAFPYSRTIGKHRK